MELSLSKHLCLLAILISSMQLTLASTTPSVEYREALFDNTTDHPVEIGYYHKPSPHSPATFQSSGFVPAKTTAKKAVRISVPMVARTASTNAQFTPLAGDTSFKIRGSSHSLVVTKQ